MNREREVGDGNGWSRGATTPTQRQAVNNAHQGGAQVDHRPEGEISRGAIERGLRGHKQGGEPTVE